MKTPWIPEIKPHTQQQQGVPCEKKVYTSHMFDSADLWCFRQRRLWNLQVRLLRGQRNSSYSRSACAERASQNTWPDHPKSLSSHNMSLHVQTPPLPQVRLLLQGALPLWKPGHQSAHGQPLKIICNFLVLGTSALPFLGHRRNPTGTRTPSCSATGSIRCASPQQKLHLSDMLRPSCLSSSASLAQQFHPAISLGDGREQWKRLRYLRFDFGPREC